MKCNLPKKDTIIKFNERFFSNGERIIKYKLLENISFNQISIDCLNLISGTVSWLYVPFFYTRFLHKEIEIL